MLVGKEGNKVAHKRNKARMLNTIGKWESMVEDTHNVILTMMYLPFSL